MAACPKCNTNISIKVSSLLKCPGCNSELMGTFSKPVRLLFVVFFFVEVLISVVITVFTSIIHPYFPNGFIVSSILLLGLMLVSVLLLIFLFNKFVVFRLK